MSDRRMFAVLKRLRGSAVPVSALSLACFLLPAASSAQQAGAQTAATIPQNAQPLQAPVQGSGIALKGTILDPDGAAIPGATVNLTPSAGKAYSVSSGADGTFSMRGVPPGTYALTITMQGFASYVQQGFKVGATAQTLNAKLAIQSEQTVVNVTTDENQVSVDPDNNASSTVLKGDDLKALSDDPDELASELQALAGPSAGPNGGQIYIDGFTGGQLPPKSSIREIRINQNPFSAEYDRPGFGRVEVFTKPGTDKLHGSVQLNGADKSFNTGSPFIAPGTLQPDYHTILAFGTVTGPINKNASYSLGGSYRAIQNNTVVDPPGIYATSSNALAACLPPFASGCTLYTNNGHGGGFNYVQFSPETRYDFSPRIDLALGAKNTLTVRFQYEHNSQQNQGIGGGDIYSTGYSTDSAETTLQVSDSQIFNSKVINETRFEYQRPTSTVTPFSTAPNISVEGGFTGGGNIAQSSQDTQNHIEVQNYTSIALAKHFIRLGGRLRSTSDSNTTLANDNGSFLYNSISNYAANAPSTFQITAIARPTVSARSTDLGIYAEDDWKIRPNLTFSYGLRFETQNFIPDHHDFAPRLSAAYGVGKKTVIRVGAGIFYDRFALGNQLSVVRNNGVNQQLFTLSAGSGVLPATCTPSAVGACEALATNSGLLTERVIESNAVAGFHNLTSPEQIQENIGVDQQLFKGATLSENYQHIRGVHQFNSDVPNYSTAGNTTANPLLYQFQSNGVFSQNQLITNVNYRGRYGTVGSYYVLNFANSDASGAGSFASIPNNLAADYGRASFDVRNRVFVFGSFPLPHLITLSPFLVAQSGNPYNIYSGQDPFGDNTFNQRAVLVPNGTNLAPTGSQLVKTIAGCGTYATPGYAGITTPAPINNCTGPANFTLNLRIAKTFGFGEKRGADAQQQGPGGGGGRQGGPPGGGRGGGGGGRGGFGGGGASSGRRYNLTIGAQAQNLFNVNDRNVPVGTLTSPLFGTSEQLAGGIYTTDSAVRRFTLQASFTF
jgi:uncharacterized membrane protein YgcG